MQAPRYCDYSFSDIATHLTRIYTRCSLLWSSSSVEFWWSWLWVHRHLLIMQVCSSLYLELLKYEFNSLACIDTGAVNCKGAGWTSCCRVGECYVPDKNCFCDFTCHMFGDCCSDIDATCPQTAKSQGMPLHLACTLSLVLCTCCFWNYLYSLYSLWCWRGSAQQRCI